MPVSTRKGVDGIKPYWQSECGRAAIYVGDCANVMDQLERDQFHAIVTDPPYGLEFMGREWDAPWKTSGYIETCDEGTDVSHPFRNGTQRVVYGREAKAYQQWFYQRAAKMLRVAKPGAHMLSFGGTRMWHWMACAIEDAEWEIRDTIMWLYSSGFPKSHNVSQAIDKMMGAKRKAVGKGASNLSQGQFNQANRVDGGYGFKADYDITAPATPAAQQWDGWGTTLKPAVEPIVLARKATTGSVAECVMEHSCGALNIDACRVGTTGATIEKYVPTKTSTGSGIYQFNSGNVGDVSISSDFTKLQKDGRWPANVLHDGSPDVVDSLPQGVSRYFYCAKGNDDDRPHGKGATTHPTVKPLDLMRYLVKLVCVPGGLVLDPFMGSGSTGCAVLIEGMRFVGIEQSEEYADIAVGRLKLALQEAPELKTQPAVDVPCGTRPPPKKLD